MYKNSSPKKCSDLKLESLESRLLLNADWTGVWKFEGILTDVETDGNSYDVSTKAASTKLVINDAGDNYALTYKLGGPKETILIENYDTALEYLQDEVLYDFSEQLWDQSQIMIIEIDTNTAMVIGGNTAWYDSEATNMAYTNSFVGFITRGKVENIHRPWEGSYECTGYEIEMDTINYDDLAQVDIEAIGTTPYYNLSTFSYIDGESTEIVKPRRDVIVNDKDHSWNEESYEYSMTKVLRGPGDYLIAYDSSTLFDSPYRTELESTTASVTLLTPMPDFEYDYGPDLYTIYDTDDVPYSLLQGDTFKLPVIIGNEGNAPAKGIFDVNVYAEDGVDKILIGTVQDKLIKVNDGKTTTVNVTCTVPYDVDLGNYAITTEVDTQGQIEEIDSGYDTAITPAFLDVNEAIADLNVHILKTTLPDNIIAGNKAKIKLAIENQGNVKIKEKLDINIFLSDDDVLDETDILAKTVEDKTISLKPGKTKTMNVKFNLPVSMETGDYYLLANVTEPTTVIDPDTDNNVMYSSAFYMKENVVNLTGQFGPKDIPTNFVPGRKATVKMSVMNLGNEKVKDNMNLQLWASTDDIFGNEDDVLLSMLESKKVNLKPGKDKTYKFKFVYPGNLSTQDITFFGVIDSTDSIAESDETDNLVMG